MNCWWDSRVLSNPESKSIFDDSTPEDQKCQIIELSFIYSNKWKRTLYNDRRQARAIAKRQYMFQTFL